MSASGFELHEYDMLIATSFSAYTGYIDVQARHLFFYFFESRRDPDTDDVIFWTNGGPGASSTMGLFMELGESRSFSRVDCDTTRSQALAE